MKEYKRHTGGRTADLISWMTCFTERTSLIVLTQGTLDDLEIIIQEQDKAVLANVLQEIMKDT